MHVRSKKKKLLGYLLNSFLYVIYIITILFRKKRNGSLKTLNSFLFVRLDHIGDVILSTPIYHSIKEKFPNSKITVLCGSWSADIIKTNPFIDDFIVIDCPWWSSIRKDINKNHNFISSLLKICKQIKSKNFDVFIELRGDVRQIFLFGFLENIPIRISNNRSGGGFLLTHCVNYILGIHEIDQNYRLLSLFEPIQKYNKPEIYLSDKLEKVALSKISSLFPDRISYCIIFNGGRSELRRVSNLLVAKICDYLISAYGLICLFVGDKFDFNDGEMIKEHIVADKNLFINACAKFSLLELKAMINEAKIFISSDSSVAQISASTNVNSISLFGPVNPLQSKPLGSNKKIIYHHYACSPCLQDKCILTNSSKFSKCMQDITFEEIKNLIDELSLGNNK